MSRDLRYATATIVTIGPFLDKTDGVALEDAIAEGASELITFICDGVAGGAPTVVLDMVATNASADNDVTDLGTSGYYGLELTVANTTYLGRAVLSITNAAVHCPVFHEFNILTQMEFDAKYGTGTRLADVSTIKTQGVTCAAAVTIRADVGAAGVPGANTGIVICGSNAAATFANLTVSGTSALGAVTATTIGASGAVTAASLTMTGALQAATIVSTGTTTLNALTVTNATTHSGTTVHTGAVSYADAITVAKGVAITNSTAGGAGLIVTGNTTGAGLLATGGNAGPGISALGVGVGAGVLATGGATNGKGASLVGTGTGDGLTVTGPLAVSGTTALTGAVTAPAGITATITGNLVGTVSTLTTYTGNTPQTGDSFAIVNGAHGLVSIQDDVDEILIDTAVIGALGAGLTALAQATELAKVPKSDSNVTWNATALASLQTEANDALVANHLDDLGTDWLNGGRLDLLLDGASAPSAGTVAAAVWDLDATAHQGAGTFGQAIGDPGADAHTIYGAVVTDATGVNVAADIIAIKAETAVMGATVNAEVVDALAVDTYVEPGAGAPASTASLSAKLNYLYKWTRNKKDNDGSVTQFYADDAITVHHEQTTDAAGGVVTKGEIGAP